MTQTLTLVQCSECSGGTYYMRDNVWARCTNPTCGHVVDVARDIILDPGERIVWTTGLLAYVTDGE